MKEFKTFDEQGYVLVKNLLPSAVIENLSEVVDRIYAQWMRENHADYVGHRLVNMHSLTSMRYFEGDKVGRARFFDSLASSTLTELINGMFGNGIYFHNTQLFFNPCDSKSLPYWHRDMQYGPVDDAVQASEQHNLLSLHVRIPLIREKGVELIPGTHKRWDTELERCVRFELNGQKNSEDLPNAVLVESEPGDVLVFDAQMIHRGNYRLNDSRKSLDLCIARSHPFATRYLDKSVLPDEQEMDNITHNAWYALAREIVAKCNMRPASGDAGR